MELITVLLACDTIYDRTKLCTKKTTNNYQCYPRKGLIQNNKFWLLNNFLTQTLGL